jgi:hypothetical protein
MHRAELVGTQAAADTVPADRRDSASEMTIPPHSFRVFKRAP